MLDKLKFNNLIISNATVIQKVRIQIVRKIINKMRKLKSLLEKRQNDERTIAKQRKCVAIVEEVKKIKREDMIRNILLLEKCPSKIVTNSQSTAEEVAIAMLAVNKTMQALVARLHQELGYNDQERDNWKQDLIEIGKLKAKKQRRKKRAELNDKKNNNKEPKKKLKEENKKKATIKQSSEKLDQIDKVVADTDEKTMPIITVKEKMKKNSKNDKIKKFEASQNRETICKDVEQCGDTTDSKKSEKTKIKSMKIKIEKHNKTIEQAEPAANSIDANKTDQPRSVTTEKLNIKSAKPKTVKPLKYMSGFDEMENLFSKPERSSDDYNAAAKAGVVDPFFVTETGEPYIANIVLKLNQVDEVDDSVAPQENFIRRSSKKFNAANVEDTNLHPSWLAKKKQSSIANFRGKKIKFDDTQTADAITTTSLTKTKKVASETGLHPSWVAKQKFKPTINTFQGKKITFDDDE